MLRLYREKPKETNPVNEVDKINIYYDHEGCVWVQASLNHDGSILFRKCMITDYGAILFYGESLYETDVELCDGSPPPPVRKYT